MKRLKILQPGRMGDILLVLPIAKHYYDRGYEIHWPVCSSYYPLLQYVDYVISYDIGGLGGWKERSENICPEADILDLSIGFGSGDEWKNQGLSFDKWKYRTARINFIEKYALQINRNWMKEDKLFRELGLQAGSKYDVVHNVGSADRIYSFKLRNRAFIRIIPFKEYTIFDWLGVLEKANYIYCVDSCIAMLIDQLGIGKERRYFHPWTEYYNKADLLALTPKIAPDWKIV